jgi:lysozyme
MTTPYAAADIGKDEGLRLKAYPDPLSPLAKALRLGAPNPHGLSGDPWTCGFGCTGPDVGPATEWTQDEAERRRDAKIAEKVRGLDRFLPWWRSLCDVRQDVILNMAFQLGVRGVLDFKHFCASAAAHEYADASFHMLDSDWAREQTPRRAHRLAEQFRTGVRIAP